MPTVCQTPTNNGDQFDPAGPIGLFSFEELNHIPRTTRVELLSISYHANAGASVGTQLTLYLARSPSAPGVKNSERMLLGEFDPSATLNADLSADVRLCGITLPRDPDVVNDNTNNGRFWQLEVTTKDKDTQATVCVDYVLHPYTDTAREDSD